MSEESEEFDTQLEKGNWKEYEEDESEVGRHTRYLRKQRLLEEGRC